MSGFISLKVPVPCVKGFFGNRLATYLTNVSVSDITQLLGHDPRNKNWKKLSDELRKVYEHIQRKTDTNRREGITSYIEDRFSPDALTVGAFPAISIALREPAEFEPGSDNPAVGIVRVDLSPLSIRVLIDGLGRVTGALDLLEKGGDEALEILNNFQFPVTIYAPAPGTHPLSWDEMGQLFHDFNFRVAPVSKQHAIELDQSDIYIALARRLADAPFVADHGGVAVRAASLGSKSTELVVQQILVRMVRGACEGRQFQESDLRNVDEPNLTRQNANQVRDSIAQYFGGIANEMGPDRWRDRNSLHLTSPGWQALGVIHHDVTFRLALSSDERAEVTRRIAAIDWSRFNPDWMSMGIGHAEIDKKTGNPVVDQHGRVRIALTAAGRTSVQKLIDYIRERAGIAERLNATKQNEALDA